MSTPTVHGRAGMRELQEAVRMALADGKCKGPAEISRLTDIYRGGQWHDMIVQGVLFSLQHEGEVEQCTQLNNKGGWRLAPPTAAPASGGPCGRSATTMSPDACAPHEAAHHGGLSSKRAAARRWSVG